MKDTPNPRCIAEQALDFDKRMTPGPWEVELNARRFVHFLSGSGWECFAKVYGNEDEDSLDAQGRANAQGIVFARAALPALACAFLAAEEDRDRLRELAMKVAMHSNHRGGCLWSSRQADSCECGYAALMVEFDQAILKPAVPAALAPRNMIMSAETASRGADDRVVRESPGGEGHASARCRT